MQGNRRKSAVFALYPYVFFRFDRLMQPVAETTSRHNAAGEFVDDKHLSVLHDVIDVLFHYDVGFHRLIDIVVKRGVVKVGKVLHPKEFLGFRDAFVGEIDRLFLFFVGVIFAFFQRPCESVCADIHIARFIAASRNDKGCARFVDEYAVHFVHDCKGVSALYAVFFRDRHIVAKVIEAELVVRAVSYIGVIGGFFVFRLHIVQNDADAHSEESVNLSHPLGVALCKVIVDGNDVYAVPRKRVEICRQRFDKRFSFAGLHFCDASLMQGDAAQKLHVIMTKPGNPRRRLSHRRKRFGQKCVQLFAVIVSFFQCRCNRLQLFVGHSLKSFRQFFNLIGNLFQFSDVSFVLVKKRAENTHLISLCACAQKMTFLYNTLN